MSVIIVPFKISNLSTSGRENTTVLFYLGDTGSVLDEGIEVVAVDRSQSSNALTVERKNGWNRWSAQQPFLGERKLKDISYQGDAYRWSVKHITQRRNLVVSIIDTNIFITD